MDEFLHLTAGILAGGAGTRLRSVVVADYPKVLVVVRWRSPLDHLAGIRDRIQ